MENTAYVKKAVFPVDVLPVVLIEASLVGAVSGVIVLILAPLYSEWGFNGP